MRELYLKEEIRERRVASSLGGKIHPMLDRINPKLLQSEPLERCKLGECRAACCLNGVWVDAREVEDLRAHAALILPHLPPHAQDAMEWFDGQSEPDEHSLSGFVMHSQVVEAPQHYGRRACVFLREDFKCGLQVAAQAAGLDPWRFKPFYCILHPLDLDDQGRITLDTTEAMMNEPGSCLRPSKHLTPLLVTFEPELRHMLGDKAYEELFNR